MGLELDATEAGRVRKDLVGRAERVRRSRGAAARTDAEVAQQLILCRCEVEGRRDGGADGNDGEGGRCDLSTKRSGFDWL